MSLSSKVARWSLNSTQLRAKVCISGHNLGCRATSAVAPVLAVRMMLYNAGNTSADGAGGGELPMSATRLGNSTARFAWRRVCCIPVIFSAIAMPRLFQVRFQTRLESLKLLIAAARVNHGSNTTNQGC